MWLEKGENPTYRKLLKALVNVGKRDVAELICTEIGKCIIIVIIIIVHNVIILAISNDPMAFHA